MSEKKGVISLSIDGKTVEVAEGSTVLAAARANGANIPTLCYLEKLKPIGSCRLCSVEIDGVAAPVMSCKTPVAEGMVVTTQSEALTKYRKDMMKMILVNHPLDCPVCERSGECSLQNNTFDLKVTGHTWKTNNPVKKPVVDWDLIQYDENLCILCERCIKVCREVQGFAAYKIDGLGYDSKINTISGDPLDCDFCGQCIAVCPVGALSSGMGFAGRSWEMNRTETICGHCGVGCTIMLNTKKGSVVRVTSDDFKGINNGNLCSRGRFGYEFIESEKRIKTPLIKENGAIRPAGWDEALSEVAGKLAAIKEAHGGSAFVGIGSERGTNEDAFAFQKFFREVLGSGQIDNVANMTNPDIVSGRFENFNDFPTVVSYEEFVKGNAFVYIGADGSNENPVIGNLIRQANMDHGAETAIAYSRPGVFLPAPRYQIPYDYMGLNGFVVSILNRAIASLKNGDAFDGGVDLDNDWANKVGPAAELASDTVEKLDALIKMVRERGKPVYIVGQEAQDHPQSVAIVQNIINLAKLTGGKVLLLREYANTLGVNDMGVAPNVLPGYAKEDRAELRSEASIVELLESGTAKAVIVADEDAVSRYYDSERFAKALEKAEYVLVIDQFLSSTGHLADAALPSTTFAEKDGTFTSLEGRIQKVSRAINNIGESRQVWEILSGLASKMGSNFSYNTVGEIQDEIAGSVAIYGGAVKSGGVADYGQLLSNASSLQLSEPARMGSIADGDFVLLRDHSLFRLGLYIENCPSLGDRSADGDTEIELNPADAGVLDAKDGDNVELKFGYGFKTVSGSVKLNGKVGRGTIRVPREMDCSPLTGVKVNGRSISCANLAGLRR